MFFSFGSAHIMHSDPAGCNPYTPMDSFIATAKTNCAAARHLWRS